MAAGHLFRQVFREIKVTAGEGADLGFVELLAEMVPGARKDLRAARACRARWDPEASRDLAASVASLEVLESQAQRGLQV